jgi:hypothetical protein
VVAAALETGTDRPQIGLLFITKGFVPFATVGLLALVAVGPRLRREDVIVTTGFLAGAASAAGRWIEGAVSALEVGLLTVGFSFAGAGAGAGGGEGIGTRRGPDDAELCGPEVVKVIGRRRGAADVVAQDKTLAWERTGPLTSWAEPGLVAVVGVFPLSV